MMNADSLATDPGSIAQAGNDLAGKTTTVDELVGKSLARISAVDTRVQGWRSIDRKGAREQAAHLDEEAARGERRSPLHGIPVAIKDVIDVAGWPTRAGSRSREEVPAAPGDAQIVLALRAAGAVIMGKAHTTEFAYFDGPPPTRNPHNLAHTPGGSSAGPAAVVAAGMVPLSIGTQTAGSVSRPAAYCGIAAFKPSTLAWTAQGIVPFAPGFDTPGVFGHRIADIAIAARVLMPPYLIRADATVPPSLRIGMVEDAVLDAATKAVSQSVRTAGEQIKATGHVVTPLRSRVPLAKLSEWHKTMIEYELARIQPQLVDAPPDHVTPALREAVLRGRAISEASYTVARRAIDQARDVFWRAAATLDALVFPATPDTAPAGMKTGDPRFIVPFTALGGPIVSVPTTLTPEGLPLGLMLLGAPGTDWQMLGISERLATAIELAR
jgi:aspartyl-tRNA(Asn)/glutamyl-tRNA(Gln) amidotransferase subunit A